MELVIENLKGLRGRKTITRSSAEPYKYTEFQQLKRMGKGGKVNRAEPTDVSCIEKFPGFVELFQHAGWLDFFKRIDGYNAEVSCKFAQCYKHDMVVFDTLKFRLTVDLVAEAT